VICGNPRFTPSIWNCTRVTPTLSDAFAVIDTAPNTFEPSAGARIDTDGGVESGGARRMEAAKTSRWVVPSVHIKPIWLAAAIGYPEMKLRAC